MCVCGCAYMCICACVYVFVCVCGDCMCDVYMCACVHVCTLSFIERMGVIGLIQADFAACGHIVAPDHVPWLGCG